MKNWRKAWHYMFLGQLPLVLHDVIHSVEKENGLSFELFCCIFFVMFCTLLLERFAIWFHGDDE